MNAFMSSSCVLVDFESVECTGGCHHRLSGAPPRLGMTARQDPDPSQLAQLGARVDTCVVRALPASDAIEAWIALAEAATLRG
jgi:hypothetical protein